MERSPELNYAVAEPTLWQRHGMRWLLINATILLAGVVVLIANRRSVMSFVDGKRRLYDSRRRYQETAAETVAPDHVAFDAPIERPLSEATVDPPGRWELLWSKHKFTSAGTREPVIFQHEMTTTSGLRVLVALQLDLSSNQRQLIATMLEPGTTSRQPMHYGPFVAFIDDGVFIKPFKLFAGQVDPNDDRHFTIRYENSRESGVLDGRMVDEPSATAYRAFGTIRMTRIPDPASSPTRRTYNP